MIIVTGTKRSGTSMWMQLLARAGLPTIGDAFPLEWEDRIKAANPEGFYESTFRGGIYFATNPHPETGDYIFPEQSVNHAVKVFVPGLVRTDRAFITKVIASVRPWREYAASIRRLYELEADHRRQQDPDVPQPAYQAPEFEWWQENFALISDVVTRRYPIYMVAYDAIVKRGAETLPKVFDWLGVGDADAALAQVKPELRTQEGEPPRRQVAHTTELGEEAIAVFDEYYTMVRDERDLTPTMVEAMNAVNAALEPAMLADRRRAAERNRDRQKYLRERAKRTAPT